MTDVLIVDDDQDFCVILREFFLMLGVTECVVVRSMDELETLPSIPKDLAIVDINLGPNRPSGFAVRRWLDAHGFTGEIVYLTGHPRSSPLVSEALSCTNVPLLSKPACAEELANLVR